MRVFLVETDGAGGMAHYAFQMAAALAGTGAEVTLITGRHYELDGVAAPFRVDPRLRLWPAVEPPGTRPLPAVLRNVRRLARGVRFAVEWHRLGGHLLRERPDVVQFSTIRFPFQAMMLRRLRRHGLRLAQVCHEYEPRESRLGPVRRANTRLAAAAYRCFDVMFFHGEGHRERFRTLFDTSARTVLIPHGDESLLARLADDGGDFRIRYGLGPDRPVALFFGGLRPSKGLPDLLEAFAVVREAIPDAALVIAGSPVAAFDLDGFLDRIGELSLEDSVTVEAGYVPLSELGALIRTATAVVLPYRSGTASGALQAAYAFERPVIATDVGSLAEAVEHGETGLVVPPGDIAALAAALQKLLGDPPAAAAMGIAAGRAARERFGWAPIALTVMAAYGEPS